MSPLEPDFSCHGPGGSWAPQGSPGPEFLLGLHLGPGLALGLPGSLGSPGSLLASLSPLGFLLGLSPWALPGPPWVPWVSPGTGSSGVPWVSPGTLPWVSLGSLGSLGALCARAHVFSIVYSGRSLSPSCSNRLWNFVGSFSSCDSFSSAEGSSSSSASFDSCFQQLSSQ